LAPRQIRRSGRDNLIASWPDSLMLDSTSETGSRYAEPRINRVSAFAVSSQSQARRSKRIDQAELSEARPKS
jgi:hypothetical protein